jgi:hypothetical protein
VAPPQAKQLVGGLALFVKSPVFMGDFVLTVEKEVCHFDLFPLVDRQLLLS